MFFNPIVLQPKNIEPVILAACVLNNLLRVRRPNQVRKEPDTENPVTHEVTSGEWRRDTPMPDLPSLPPGNHSTQTGKNVRNYLTAGRVAWQQNMI